MLTDQQLMLLEQLSYLHDSASGKPDAVSAAAGIEAPACSDSVADIVNAFDDEALARLESAGSIGFSKGEEVAAIIRAIKEDPELMALECRNDPDPAEGIYVYVDPAEPDRGIVVFAGTRSGEEWDDNVQGLNAADTESQREALRYVEGLPFENISVVGHSKGGNKAQYVALLDERVDQCVSMDGQGFSQEFLDKYWAEIQLRGDIIRNYSLSNDYVNILLFPVPGSQQIYCKGDPSKYGLMNHSPMAYFQYYRDENGEWHIASNIVVDENGIAHLIPTLQYTEQAFGMRFLHEFTCFILNNAPDADKNAMIAFLGPLLGLMMDGDRRAYEYIGADGKVYTFANKWDYLKSDPQTFGLIVAYFARYVVTRGLSAAELADLLYEFGLSDILLEISALMAAFPPLAALAGSAEALLLYLFHQLVDGKPDPLLMVTLKILDKLLKEKFGLSLAELWSAADSAYNRMSRGMVIADLRDGKVRANRIIDYRSSSYDAIADVMSRIDAQVCGSVDSWKNYSDEKWYGSLLVSTAIRGITLYLDHVSSVNAQCRTQIDRIFDNAARIDAARAEEVNELCAIAEQIGSRLADIQSSLG